MYTTASALLAETNFSALDWVIVGVYLALSLGIGVMVRRYVRNMTDYVAAGRGVGTALGVATLTGTEMGLITVMYAAQNGYANGFAAFHIGFVAGVVALVVGITGFFLYRLRRMGVLTIPEFYARRFGPKTRVLGGIMLTLGGVINMGLFLKVGSMFIVGITGMPEKSAALPLVMTGLLVLVLVYTVLGGMISVVVTDYVQFVVLSFGTLMAVGLALWHVGWHTAFQTVADNMGAKGFNPINPSSGYGVEYVMWMVFLGLVNCAIWPTAVARALAARSPATVRKQFAWSGVSFLIRWMIPCFLGICAFAYFTTVAPELQKTGLVAESNLYAMPVFLGRILPVGVIGILTAAMIAAFMSTHDSYLLCWSSVITQDIIAPLSGGRLSTKTRILLTRILIVVIGLYILYWGLFYKGTEKIWDYMAISGSIYSIGAFGLLAAGLYWKRASSAGAVAALVTPLLMLVALTPVQKWITGAFGWTVDGKAATFEELAQASGYTAISGARISAWMGLACIVLAVLMMVVFSLLFPAKRPPVREPAEAEGGAS